VTLAPIRPAPAVPIAGAAERHPGATGRRTAAAARTLAPGLLAVAAATTACLLVGPALPAVSPLLLAIVVGALARNARLVPEAVRPGVAWAARHLLRAGVVLLGLQLSLGAVLALRAGEVALVVVTVAVTFLATRWAGARLGVDRRTALLVATGFSICGAAAVAAMSAALPPRAPTDGPAADGAVADGPAADGAGSRADVPAADDGVAAAVAMVTVFGSLALVAMPLAQGPLGLDDRQVGVWIGASVHEVAQVVAAASGISAAALAVAVVVKLARVALLAPLVALVGAVERHRDDRSRAGTATDRRPPLVPLFVLGFLVAVGVRSTGAVPDVALDGARLAGTALLTAAMLGLGADVHVGTLVRTGGRTLALGAVSTAVTTTVSLAGLYLVAA
jgi:uncharacterized membrane protein YadS